MIKSTLALILTCLFFLNHNASVAANLPLLPVPQKLEVSGEVFRLGQATRIEVDGAARSTGEYLAQRLFQDRERVAVIQAGVEIPRRRDFILITTNLANPSLGQEGYELTVTSNSVVIRAPAAAGLFYGVQSLLQLMPPKIFSSSAARDTNWSVPGVRIEDRPRFQWRGFMLDVSRHFFTKEEVMRLLDEMAFHKLNTFHWHLVDDGGWRIEIQKYPKLTEVGAWRAGVGFDLKPDSTTAYGPDGRYGGFYTQKEIREVLDYAAARFITVVPEIEMPGHSLAALAAYPEYSCTGGPFSPQMKCSIFHGVYCAGSEETFVFLENILEEVCQIFPGRNVHIGGDEVLMESWKKCPKCQLRMRNENLKNEHELQNWFVKRVERMLEARGRNMVGWSEIRNGDLASTSIVMDWIGGGLEAAQNGHDVVMSPTKFCYLDYYQAKDKKAEPRAIGGYLPLSKVYEFEPIPEGLSADKMKHILGGQGNLWTEFVPNLAHAEYMAFPRLSALAEVLWSPKDARNWDSFTNRLAQHTKRFDFLGVNYRRQSDEPTMPSAHSK